MPYYVAKTVTGPFDRALAEVVEHLKNEGFGVLTDIDVQATLKNKIGANISQYRILGACNPGFAHEALKLEDKLGVLLPCNVIVQEHENGKVEISAVDPVASMMAVKNDSLGNVATQVREKLNRVINNL